MTEHSLLLSSVISDRRICHDRNAPLTTPLQQLPLDPTMQEVVQDLVCSDPIPSPQCVRFLHVVNIKIAYAIVPDRSIVFQKLKSFESLHKGHIFEAFQFLKDN